MKTRPTDASVDAFLSSVDDEARRNDCRAVAAIMQRATGEPPEMWGPSMVGFGRYHYKYESGREGDWFLAGFSPRKKDLTLYVTAGADRFPELMDRLGKFKTGRSCVYIKRLADVDEEVLEELVARAAAYMRATNQ